MGARSLVLVTLVALAFVPRCNEDAKRTSSQVVTFAAAGDFGMSDDAGATLELMGRSNVNFVLALGDLSYSGDVAESEWCKYVRSKVGPSLPVELIAGNHEDDYGGNGRIMKFAACMPDKMGATGEYARQYYFDHGKLARFIMLSPDLTIDGQHYYYGDSNANFKWVADVIDNARASGISWLVVGMHKNCLSVGSYYCNIYSDLMNLLVNKKVDLVLQAHDHTYQRTAQLAAGPACKEVLIDSFNSNCVVDDGKDHQYTKGKGPVFVVVGTAGGDLFDINAKDTEAGYFAAWMGANVNPRKGFGKFVVSNNEITGEFVGSTTTSNFTDSFVIRRAQLR